MKTYRDHLLDLEISMTNDQFRLVHLIAGIAHTEGILEGVNQLAAAFKGEAKRRVKS